LENNIQKKLLKIWVMLCPIVRVKFNTCQMLWVWFMHMFSFRVFLFCYFPICHLWLWTATFILKSKVGLACVLIKTWRAFSQTREPTFLSHLNKTFIWVQLLILRSFYVKKHSTRVCSWIAVRLAILKHGALWDSQRYWLWEFCCGQTG